MSRLFLSSITRLAPLPIVLLLAIQGTPPKVPADVAAALKDYLSADTTKEKAALERVVKSVKGKLEIAAAAIRAATPLTEAKPGVYHNKIFKSNQTDWNYSIRLPNNYDGKKLYPVLVLPDHGSVDENSGVRIWEQSEHIDKFIIFRPVIVKFAEDKDKFPDQSFFGKGQAIAKVFNDALTHLRLHYAADPERLFMTGLSQAGYYSWYYSVSFPDQFACVIPESSGGAALLGGVLPLARNVANLNIRILHCDKDEICPYADAKKMESAIREAGGTAEFITYTESDYGGDPFPKFHPGPHSLRLKNVLPFGYSRSRNIPKTFSRVLKYSQQGFEGRFRIAPPSDPAKPITVNFKDDNGSISCDAKGAVYCISPDDILAKRGIKIGDAPVALKGDIALLFKTFKTTGDKGRLVAAEVPLN